MGDIIMQKFLEELLLDALAYKKMYDGLDMKKIRRFHKVVEENSKEAYQVSRANHGGASPYPYTYKS